MFGIVVMGEERFARTFIPFRTTFGLVSDTSLELDLTAKVMISRFR